MTNLQALSLLRSGTQEPVNVTFTHVRLLSELGERITKNLGMTSDQFYAGLNEFIATNHEGFNENNVLCMFIPNTYEVYYAVTGRAEDGFRKVAEQEAARAGGSSRGALAAGTRSGCASRLGCSGSGDEGGSGSARE
jgi:hypothetical protein